MKNFIANISKGNAIAAIALSAVALAINTATILRKDADESEKVYSGCLCAANISTLGIGIAALVQGGKHES